MLTTVGRQAASIQRASGGSVPASRETAVQRVFRGGVATLTGAALATGTMFLPGSPAALFAFWTGAFVLGGLGLVEIGRAAGHFLRYGSRTSQLTMGVAAATGVSVVTAGLANWIGVTFGTPAWEGVLVPVVHWAMNGVYTFGVVLALLTLWSVVRLSLDADGDGRDSR